MTRLYISCMGDIENHRQHSLGDCSLFTIVFNSGVSM